MAVGLARTLRVGELVELVDVGLGNHDVDGGEHEWAPRGIVLVIVSLLDELRPETWTRLMVVVMRLAVGPDPGILLGSGP